MSILYDRLRKYGYISPEAEKEIKQHIVTMEKRKGDLLIKTGQVSKNLYILEKGSIRAYLMKGDKEVSTWFLFEDYFFSPVFSLFNNKPSRENIQLIEDAVINYIPYETLLSLCNIYPELNLIVRKIIEEYCSFIEERMLSFQIESATERYNNLIKEYPESLQRISLGYIASYLGISQETLSRIRKNK